MTFRFPISFLKNLEICYIDQFYFPLFYLLQINVRSLFSQQHPNMTAHSIVAHVDSVLSKKSREIEKGESVVAPGTLLKTTHTYVIKTGTQDKTGTKRVDLLRGQKTDRVDFSLQPEELDAMGNVLQYEEAREEEK
ncbi:hypothetical protein AtEden1_Chr1g0012211 [Arabidopsis thaliana]